MLRLREGEAPANAPEVMTKGGGVANVSVPEMAVHLPAPGEANGLALLVLPGGSYREVGAFADGMRTVPHFVPKGVAVIVLKYRTRPPSRDVVRDALADAQRAMRLLRAHARDWGIKRIGVVGSSAGSHLALNLATHADGGATDASDPVERESCRPDFLVLLCPWPNGRGAEQFPIGAETPPAFIAGAKDDRIAPLAFAEDLVAAYRKAGVPVALWELESGGHTAFKQVHNPGYHWMARATEWLQEQRLWNE